MKQLSRTDYFCWQNERHAAWERSGTMQNERHTAWERVFCPHGPDWSPQKVPPKASQTNYFKTFLKLLGAPLEHPSCPHQKMEQLKWAPKSAHSECSKYTFSKQFQRICSLAAASGTPFFCDSLSKYAISHWFYSYFGRHH